jgi:diamine N-acetyltransferase
MEEIRHITQSELDELRLLAADIYRTTFEAVNFEAVNTKENMDNYIAGAFSTEQVAMEFAEPGSVLMGAFSGARMVGYLRLRQTDEVLKYLGASNIEIQRLYIHPSHQGKGLANSMMQVCVDKAKELGMAWLWLGVWEQNTKAQRFYERWGFEKFSEHVFWMGDDAQTDWLMKKKIL